MRVSGADTGAALMYGADRELSETAGLVVFGYDYVWLGLRGEREVDAWSSLHAARRRRAV